MSSSSNSTTPTSINSAYYMNQQQQQQQQHPHQLIYASNNPNVMSGAGSAVSGVGGSYSTVQKQIQQDWSNREYIEVILSNIKKIADFLNTFDLSCRSRLAILDEKLTKLERQIDFIEARVTKGETLN